MRPCRKWVTWFFAYKIVTIIRSLNYRHRRIYLNNFYF